LHRTSLRYTGREYVPGSERIRLAPDARFSVRRQRASGERERRTRASRSPGAT